jgi:hypothetical protein
MKFIAEFLYIDTKYHTIHNLCSAMRDNKSRKASRFHAHNDPWNKDVKISSSTFEDTVQQPPDTGKTADEFSLVSYPKQ